MPLHFRGKLHDLLHGKPEKPAASSSYEANPNANVPSTARPSSPAIQHPTPPIESDPRPDSELGTSSPTSRASLSQTHSREMTAFNAKWEAPIARQRRYNEGLPPLPGQPEYTEEDKREARGLKQIDEIYKKMQMDSLLESDFKSADKKYEEIMKEDRLRRERNREEYEKSRKEEDLDV